MDPGELVKARVLSVQTPVRGAVWSRLGPRCESQAALRLRFELEARVELAVATNVGNPCWHKLWDRRLW